MSLTLSLHTSPEVPVEADVLCHDRLNNLNESALSALTVFHGNEQAELGDFFKAQGDYNGELRIEGDLSKVKHIGAGMTGGKLTVTGDVGAHLGAGMSGGEIVIEGNTGDWVASEMTGGRIIIKGNAGHMVGSAVRGSPIGITGGEIIVHGNVRNEAGNGMRNGLIAIGGNSEDLTGVNMNAGTIIVLGNMGIRSGAGMKRGTILSMHEAEEMLPTFTYASTYNPTYIRLYLEYIRKLGLQIDDAQFTGNYERWVGDSIELNRGEILIYKN
jgi:formylmethanofuran dehydrogenase subunit C